MALEKIIIGKYAMYNLFVYLKIGMPLDRLIPTTSSNMNNDHFTLQILVQFRL